MAKNINELSVFCPAYNREVQIKNTVESAFIAIPKMVDKYEIIVVNDGSRDKTGRVLSKLSLEYPNLKVITHKINKGYGATLKSGWYGAKYPWIAFTDGDGQFEITEMGKLLDEQKRTGADFVIGYYRKRRVSTFKIITSKIWELIVYLLFGLRVRDIDCGFKLISKRVIDKIPKLESERGAFISSELLVKAKRSGFNITEIGVTHYAQPEGKGTGRDLKVIIKSFIHLMKLWKKLR